MDLMIKLCLLAREGREVYFLKVTKDLAFRSEGKAKSSTLMG